MRPAQNNNTAGAGQGTVTGATVIKAIEKKDSGVTLWPLLFGVLLIAGLVLTISAASLHKAAVSMTDTLIPYAPAAERAFIEIERSRGLPVRGQSRASVRNQFGEPVQNKSAVGKPPISSWVYPDFTVYFEYDLVITTVASKDHLPTRLDDIQ